MKEIEVVTASDLVGILEAFINGSASRKTVEDWAEDRDANDSVEFCSDLVRDCIFELSTPEISGKLSVDRAAVLLAELKRAD